MKEVRRKVGENIRKVCALKGIRQVDIAERMKVSQGTVSNWFKGTNSIDIENLAELCQFLGVSLDQIFGVKPLEPDVLLSPEEADLISAFRSLNRDAQSTLLNTAKAFVGNPAMQKNDSQSETA